MNEAASKSMIVGLDIGTSKVVAIVGDIKKEGGLDIVGIGSHQSRGLKTVSYTHLTLPTKRIV